MGDLEVFDGGAEVNLESLRDKRLLRGRFDQLKILGDGDLSKALIVTAHRFSKSAIAKIEKAGGKAVVIAPRHATETKAETTSAS